MLHYSLCTVLCFLTLYPVTKSIYNRLWEKLPLMHKTSGHTFHHQKIAIHINYNSCCINAIDECALKSSIWILYKMIIMALYFWASWLCNIWTLNDQDTVIIQSTPSKILKRIRRYTFIITIKHAKLITLIRNRHHYYHDPKQNLGHI